MTLDELKACTRKELTELAKRHRVSGWHPMRKDELVKAIAAVTRGKKPVSRSTGKKAEATARKSASGRGRAASTASRASGARSRNRSANSPVSSRPARRGKGELGRSHFGQRSEADSSKRTTSGQPERDQIQVHVCDAYWLQAEWEVSRGMISRAEAALRAEWHTAQPVIRLFDVTSDESTSTLKTRVRDIRIRGDVTSWFIEVENPERSYKLHLGYLTSSGRFFVVAKSRKICPSNPGRNGQRWNGYQGDSGLAHVARGGEPLAGVKGNGFLNDMSAGPSASPGLFKFGNEGSGSSPSSTFFLRMDAELIVSGATLPGTNLNLLGNTVPLDADGTFSVRFSLPNGRQVIPATAVAPDSTEQRTIVLAIERNTKELEPHVFDESPL